VKQHCYVQDMAAIFTVQRTGLSAFITAILLLFSNAIGADTRLVILGTGTPVTDGDRYGPSVAVIHDGEAYVFDAGGGMVQRAIQAKERLGIEALDPIRIKYLFFTHLHSDHVLDYPELTSTLWWRRTQKLKAWGPAGLQEMTEGMYRMMEPDIRIRTGGTQPIEHPDYYQVDVTEIGEGIIFDANGVQIEAFAVPHGDIRPAFGYRVRTPDKTIVISGDTAYSEKLIEMATGADILVHEVSSEQALNGLSEFWQNYHNHAHTTTSRLAEVANKAKPGLLVLYHILFYGASPESVLAEIRRDYDGKVVLPDDLAIF